MNKILSLVILTMALMLLSLMGMSTELPKVMPDRIQLAPPPITIIPVQRSEKPIEISSFDVSSKIYGNLAQTDLTISFYNPNTRDISADFIFPIPANSTINGYVLDVNGVMVDGVAVEKNKARVTFEKIVRQGIDPGLVEKVAGNVFKTRIFPLAAKQARTISIQFSSVLSQNGGAYDYQIPLMAGQLIKAFSMRIEAMNTMLKPIITGDQFADTGFSTWNNAYLSEFKKANFTLEKPLTIAVPKLADNLVIVGENQAGDYYFSINPKLSNKFQKRPDPLQRKNIKKVQLVWDASHSRYNTDHQLELDLLTAFFKQYKNLDVELYLLRNQIKFEQIFKINNGNWGELKQQLSAVQYDGATNFSELNKLPSQSKPDYVLLFTDGLHTISKKEMVKTPVPLYVFANGLAGNLAYNQQLAEQNNGQAFQLSKQVDFSAIFSQIGKPVPQLISIDVNKGQVKGLSVLPQSINFTNPQPITAQLLSSNASLTLNYGFSGKATEMIKVTITRKEASSNDLPELIWAQQRLDSLQKDGETNKSAIIQLSQKYSMVSDFTSLIVLENLQQYVEHEIIPPKSLSQMRNDYFTQIKQLKKDKQKIETDKILQVVSMWDKRKKWWAKKFPLISKPKLKIKEYLHISESGAMPLSAPVDQEEFDAITVTGSNIRGVEMDQEPSYAAEKKEKSTSNPHTATVKISEWDPDTPYLKSLKKTKQSNRLSQYYQLKKDYFNSPAFYFDCANFFFKQQDEIGLQILSNIAELKIQDSRLLRTMAMKLKENNYLNLSIQTYRKVLSDRPEEPQSLRDLALALQQRAVLNNGVKKDYSESIELLYKIITSQWDRFNGIEVTVLMEINQMIPQLKAHNINYSFIDKRLIDLLDVDVRIVLGWDSDMTDIDLWVIEPNGEKVAYDHTLSGVGGMFHQDFTGGYGPEEYLIHKAPTGDYTIKVHFYGNNSPELSGATTLYVDVFTNYARANQKKQTLTLRLENASDDYLVGTINYQ